MIFLFEGGGLVGLKADVIMKSNKIVDITRVHSASILSTTQMEETIMDMKVTFDIDIDEGIEALKIISDALTKSHDWDEIPQMIDNFWDALDKGVQLAINMLNVDVEFKYDAKILIDEAGCENAFELVSDMAAEAIADDAEPAEGSRGLKSRKRPGLHMYFNRIRPHVGR